MKVLTIQASPRDTGNTSTILEWVEEELKDGGHEVERMWLGRKMIYDCQGCYFCQGQEEPGVCKITRDAPPGEDAAKEVFDAMAETDAIVFGSPLYCWSLTANVHALFHRAISHVRNYGQESHKTTFQGKRAGLLVSCAGPLEGNADLVTPMFERACKFLKMEKAGELIVPGCMEPAILEPQVKENAIAFAKEIAG